MLAPYAAGVGYFNGASCPGSTSCFAVGYTEPLLNDSKALIEQWVGTAWTKVA